MALFPCNERVICPGSDSPISNWSSEDPDLLNFAAFKFPIWNPNNPINGGDTTGWLPTWLAAGCTGICVSTVSLDDARLCAQRAAFICANTPASGTAPAFFYNTFQSCAFTCPDGTLFVWNIVPGTFVALSVEQANQMAQAYACQQAAVRRVCLGDFVSPACIGDFYSSTIKLDGAAPVGVELTTGSLPPGLNLSQNPTGTTATLSGIPTAGGVFAFTLTATDNLGNYHVKNFTFGVMAISNSGAIPAGSQNTPYSFQLTGVGGTAPYTFSVVGGSLPTGLTLSSTGLLSGTPTTAQTSAFTVQLLDSAGNDCLVNCAMVVNPAGCGIDFTTGLNNTPTLGPGASWTINVLPASVTFTAAVTLSNIGGEAFITNGLIQFPYTGSGCNLHFQVTLAGWTIASIVSGGFRILQDGVELRTFDAKIASGTSNFWDFTVPLLAGVGSSIVIAPPVDNHWIDYFLNTTGNCSMQVVITNS